jgi:hypothetical protein
LQYLAFALLAMLAAIIGAGMVVSLVALFMPDATSTPPRDDQQCRDCNDDGSHCEHMCQKCRQFAYAI